ncbi:Plancitoxin-1 [Scenedesmus sp. PABB004]|nr:Plancitoxin-1 [Scenedesmus sp. PABB004]
MGTCRERRGRRGQARTARREPRRWALAAAALLAACCAPRAVAAAAAATSPAWCVGLEGRRVDWFVMLKHPRGFNYSYLDARRVARRGGCGGGACWAHGLSMAPRGGGGGGGNPVAATLAVLVPPGGGVAHVAYNDDPPRGAEHFDAAHAKGVIAAGLHAAAPGGVAGFWLTHSAPRFPDDPRAGPGFADLAPPQSVFAQHFACFSLAAPGLAGAAELLRTSAPFVSSSALPPALAARLPAWAALLGGGGAPAPPRPAVQLRLRLRTAGGQALTAFSAAAQLNASLTDDVIGPALRADMAGAGVDSLNVAAVAFAGTRVAWPASEEHSKWGVEAGALDPPDVDPPDRPGPRQRAGWVCLGDKNRAASQARRGGGAVCLQHAALWAALAGVVAGVEGCGGGASGLRVARGGAPSAAAS